MANNELLPAEAQRALTALYKSREGQPDMTHEEFAKYDAERKRLMKMAQSREPRG